MNPERHTLHTPPSGRATSTCHPHTHAQVIKQHIFINPGLTLYTAKWARRDPQRTDGWWVYTKDVQGQLIGEQAESYW